MPQPGQSVCRCCYRVAAQPTVSPIFVFVGRSCSCSCFSSLSSPKGTCFLPLPLSLLPVPFVCHPVGSAVVVVVASAFVVILSAAKNPQFLNPACGKYLSSPKPTKPTPIKTFQLRRSFTQPAIIKSTKQIKAPRPTTGAILFVGSTSCKEVRR